MKPLVIALLGLHLTACGAYAPALHCSPATKSVGMWYSTWYKGSSDAFWGLYSPYQGRYSSSDDATIDAHINLLEQANVDFVILDNTNNLHVDGGYILDSSLRFFDRLAGRRLKAAVAIGGMQFGGGADTLRRELTEVTALFVNGPQPDAYLRSPKGPIVVSYAPDDLSQNDMDTLAASYPSIDLQWIHGTARVGEPGWANPAASLPSCDTMAVMPGWQNAYGHRVDRMGGAFYDISLKAALSVNPARVVIASFNDYAEQTAVEPTNEYGDVYWKKTVDFIATYKAP